MSEYGNNEIKRMHKELLDDDWIAQNKWKQERIKRLEDKKSDTGL